VKDDRLYELHAAICSTLAHPTRLKLIDCLQDGAKSVTELVAEIRAPQPTVSRHLAKMRRLGVVSTERRGQCVYYHLSSPKISQAYQLMYTFAQEWLAGQSVLMQDMQQ